MESILSSAVRKFRDSEHIKSVLDGAWTTLFDESGEPLPGIRGRKGVCAITEAGHEIGVDLIEMQPGSEFALHVHPGDHILFVIAGRGAVNVDGVDHPISAGNTIFVPAEYPHGVRTLPDMREPLTFLAFGHPHKALDSPDRMHLVT